jgi:hypothetical protein
MTCTRAVPRGFGPPVPVGPCRAEAWHGLSATVARSGSVGRVELKVLLDARLEEAVAALRPSRGAVRRRQVYYLDTPGLDLRDQGILIRARIPRHGGADLVVKLRVPDARELPRSVSRLSGLSVELDALPHGTQWCASVKSRPRRLPPRPDERPKRRGKRLAWSDILSADQHTFLTRLAEDPELVNEIRPFGPVSVRKFVGRVPGLARVAVESWTYPDGDELLELSAKCAPAQANRTAQRLRRLLEDHRLTPLSWQLSKTEVSLRRFGQGCAAGPC